ncbi:MAG: cob(I)yrinic acid a,c-diamide adenosyltransferase [Candidatus Korarchaeota archaeon]|nr:cob(I)yrinic acid a,c-diamide adenosyltransferase [Candidatus Korarchaeota archaeon]
MREGLVHLYTGNGKGKTTAAFGLALRVAGRGGRVLIVQFLKGLPTGEVMAVRKIPEIEVRRFGSERFVDPKRPTEEDIAMAKRGLKEAMEAMSSGNYRLVVLDEVNVAVAFNLIDEREVISAVKSRHPRTEVVLTGRYAPPSFYELSDYVTEFKEVKHPFSSGIPAREGIEY